MAKNIFEKVLENVDIVEVIGRFVELNQRGASFFGRCPFHNDHDDKNFSVKRDIGNGIYTCFRCKADGSPNGQGNAIEFIANYKKISSIEACKFLAKEYNIDISEFERKEENALDKYYKMADLSMLFFKYCINNSNVSKEALDYLHKRGITDECISDFNIGLSISEKDALTKILVDKGFIEYDIEKNSLSTGKADLFIDRIMVPIRDDLGRVVAFGGRIYKDGQNQNKYLNSKETPIFKKGKLVFNLDKAKEYVRDTGYLIINEGYMDVIQEYSKGIKNCVALMGTSLTTEQAKLIAKYSKNVCIILDGDDAGFNAVGSCYNKLIEEGLVPSIVKLPDKMDPDEYLRTHTKEEYLDLIKNNKIDKYTYDYMIVKNEFGNINSYNFGQFENKIFEKLKDEKSKSVIENTLRRLSLDLNISFDSIYEDFYVFTGKKKVIEPIDEIEENKTFTSQGKFDVGSLIEKAEKLIINYALKDYKYFQIIETQQESRVFLKNSLYKAIFIEIGDIYDNNKEISREDLIDELKRRNVYGDFYFDSKIDYSSKDLIENVLKSLKRADIKEKIEALKYQLSTCEAGSDISKTFQEEIVRLLKELKNDKRTR